MTEKQLAGYKLLDKLQAKTNNKEIGPIMNYVSSLESPVKTVSQAPPGGGPERSKTPTLFDIRTGGDRSMTPPRDRLGQTPLAKPAAVPPVKTDVLKNTEIVDKIRGARSQLSSKSKSRILP